MCLSRTQCTLWLDDQLNVIQLLGLQILLCCGRGILKLQAQKGCSIAKNRTFSNTTPAHKHIPPKLQSQGA